MMVSTILMRTTNKAKYQYSLRLERPLKTAYYTQRLDKPAHPLPPVVLRRLGRVAAARIIGELDTKR